MLDELVRFDFAQLRDFDGIGFTHARQVIAHQINDHDVLGPILFALPQIVTCIQVGLSRRDVVAAFL